MRQKCDVLVEDKPTVTRPLDEGQKRIKKATRIDEGDWLLEHSDLPQREHFKELVQCSIAPREDHEAIGELDHLGFSIHERRDDVQLREAAVRDFLFYEWLGDHANGLTPCGQDRVGDRPHHSNVGTAIHEAPSPSRKAGAEFRGRLLKLRTLT